jgi:magnesium transporter
VIDVELYTDEMRDLSGGLDDNLFQLIGVHLTRARRQNPFSAFRSRFPWLMCNVLGGVVAAFLSGVFRAEIEEAVALALFMPVVLALAESVSIQSITLTLQVLHGKPPSWSLIFKKLWGELAVGLLLGTAGGLLVAMVAMLWIDHIILAGCVFCGIVAGGVSAAVLGAAIPNLLRRLKLDPRVAAGPLVLALTDVITLLCYFNFARWLLH